jgi:peptidase A4-like protein
MSVRLWLLVAALITAIAAVSATAALADSTSSSNWAGYAVHRQGVSFRSVTGTWRQPRVHCTPGMPTYSAFWVGLGGYSLNALALEQTGTEVDCNPSGKMVSSVWYELVPGPSLPIRLKVRPADRIRASVTVSSHRVTIRLDDLTRHRGFHKTVFAPNIDVSSAEWIVEAPSACVSAGSCKTLPLANFAPTQFRAASVSTTGGHAGTISDPAWGWTRITLTPGGRRFSVHGTDRATAAAAKPSSLLSKGRAFAVNFAEPPVSASAKPARAAALRPSGLFY